MYVIYDSQIDRVLEDTRMDNHSLIKSMVKELNKKAGYDRYFVSIQKGD